MIPGKIKTVRPDKGFGFIKSPKLDRDVFFHYSALPAGLAIDQLMPGNAVEFEYVSEPRGFKAISVKLA